MMHSILLRTVWCLAGLALNAPLHAQNVPCPDQWVPTFGQRAGILSPFLPSSPIGFDGVRAMVEFDDGSGPVLYAAGLIPDAGGVPTFGVARWDGELWSAVGDNLTGIGGGWPECSSLEVFDDGTGPALYVGGLFESTTDGGRHLAKWNGTEWEIVGGGTDEPVTSLQAVDLGGGPRLIVGGHFQNAGGQPHGYLTAWTGTAFEALPSTPNGPVHALGLHDDGSGTALYVGGKFLQIGSQTAWSIGRFDGTAWSTLGSGVSFSGASLRTVYALHSYDDGNGAALIAGGDFSQASGAPGTFGIAQWRGGAWSAVASGVASATASIHGYSVRALEVWDAGQGPELYVGGSFEGGQLASDPKGHVLRYAGSGWLPVDPNVHGETPVVYALHAAAPGGAASSQLFVGGTFQALGVFGSPQVERALSIASWDGQGWSVLGDGLEAAVVAMVTFDDGTGFGERLYFTGARGTLLRWDGGSWTALSSPTIAAQIFDLAVFDDGTGPAIFACGRFENLGGPTLNNIAKWNGVTWEPLGTGLTDSFGTWVIDANAMQVWDDGSGDALYVGGSFEQAGGMPATLIARWNGLVWTTVGQGIQPGSVFSPAEILAMTVTDTGQGESLYVGGANLTSTGDGTGIAQVARWDGANWHALGAGVNANVDSLAAFGGELVAGGTFTEADSQPASRMAKWNGSTWSPLGSGTDGRVRSMQVADLGQGERLFVGGSFELAGGFPVTNLAQWDGVHWDPLAGGVIGTVSIPEVFDMALLDDGAGLGNSLYVGGSFTSAVPDGDSYLARWSRCPFVQSFCEPTALNSAGLSTRLEATLGAPSPSGLHLDAFDGPPSQFGYLLVGAAVDPVGIPLSTGRLCLSLQAPIGRYNILGPRNSLGQFDAQGAFQNLVGTSSTGLGYDVPLSIPGLGGTIQSGQTLHFQLWHREPAGASHLSQGLSVTF